MIINSIVSSVNSMLTSSYHRNGFIIYDSAVLNSKNKIDYENNKLLQFDGFTNLSYTNNVLIPKQALENRAFTNDSIIDSPFELRITAVVSEHATSLKDLNADYAGKISSTIETIGKSDKILTIIRESPMFATYNNLKLQSWSYEQSPERTGLFLNMVFQEIRTAYVPNNNSSNYVQPSFSNDNSKNPSNQNQLDNGIINTAPPSGNINNLQPTTRGLF